MRACSSTAEVANGDPPDDQGSIFFTAAADDPFAQEYEARRRVCTSQHESVKTQPSRSGADLLDDKYDSCKELHICARSRQPLSNILNRSTSELFQVSSMRLKLLAKGHVCCCTQRTSTHLICF
jgi:hypothetical protein